MRTSERVNDESMVENSPIAELAQALGRTPVELQQLIFGLSNNQMRIRGASDEFSVTENLCHLRDIEIEGYAVRIRRILDENEPHLQDIDGGKLAVERNYNTQSPTQALKEFKEARAENLKILDQIQEHELRREGNLEGVGKISLQKLVGLMQEHDEGHISDLKILRRSIESYES